MEDTRIFLGKVGEWSWSKFYFDKENNCFIEEKYHEEYLDTGTVFEGSNTVTAEYVYNTFVEYMNTDGITNLLKCVENFEIPQSSEKQITEQEFLEKLEGFDKALRWKLERIDSTFIFRNQQSHIIGVLSKTELFFVYVDLYKKSKGFISQNEAFSYIIECLSERYELSKDTTIANIPHTKERNEAPQKKAKRLGMLLKKR